MFIPSIRRPDWPATERDMKMYFRLEPKDKWPAEGLPAITIGMAGIRAWVAPLNAESRQGVPRCFVSCPVCSRTLSFSRLPQHYRVHK